MKNEYTEDKKNKSLNECLTESDHLGLIETVREESLKDPFLNTIYSYNDFLVLHGLNPFSSNPTTSLETLEELMKRDKKREEDGFPRKIKIGRIPAEKGKIIIVPTTEESKLFHGSFEPGSGQGDQTGGSGEGEEGEEIAEQPIEPECGEGEDSGAGEGDGGEHGLDTEAYEYGKKLSEKFKLPHLIDKGKKIPSDKVVYDFTDRLKGSGQILDKKATLKQIIKTNFGLGRIPDPYKIDPSKFIIAPSDHIYRVLSSEKVYESQAVIFLARDYSGSMWGKPTEAVVAQHLMIYSWLMFQYSHLVIPRFIVHDVIAKEVPNFDIYYRIKAGGGTKVSSPFELINKIVFEEGLERDYNIYVFYGTDGDNWGDDSGAFIHHLEKTLEFTNRTGIAVVKNDWGWIGGNRDQTEVEQQIKESNLEKDKARFRLAVMKANEATEKNNIETVKKLISE